MADPDILFQSYGLYRMGPYYRCHLVIRRTNNLIRILKPHPNLKILVLKKLTHKSLWVQQKILIRGDRITISGIIEEAKKNGIEYKTIHDAGRTEIEAGSLTVLTLGPEFEEKLENLCSFLPIIE